MKSSGRPKKIRWSECRLARKGEALREGERGDGGSARGETLVDGPTRMIEYFALVAAWMGEKELGCEHMEKATGLSGSGLLTQ
jgi:hypothetical protein